MNVAVPTLMMLHLLPTAADAEKSVTAGHEALDQWWGYPWYDPATDGVRRIDIPESRDWSWLRDWLPDFSAMGDWTGGWPDTLLGYAAWTVLVLALAAVAYLLIRAYLNREGHPAASARDQQPPDDRDDDRIEALPMPVQRGRSDLLGEAQRHYRQGNYGQAIVYLFSFQLVQLDKRQIIRLTKGKTNRQYLREVGGQASLRRLLEQTMLAFEDVFFGNRTLDRARFESCWSQLDEFTAACNSASTPLPTTSLETAR